MKRVRVLFTLFAAVSVLLAACVAVQPTTTTDGGATVEDEWGVVTIASGSSIKIGFSAALSGAGVDVLGIDEQQGVELALEDKPEILGFSVELDVQDDLCSSEGGQTVASKFVADPQIVAVVGHMCSSSCTAAVGIYEPAGYTMVSPSCTAVALTLGENASPSFNRVAWNDKIQAPVDAQFAYETLGARTAATIHDGSPYGEGLAVAFAEAFTALGGEVVAQNAVNVGDTDMKSVLLDIKTSGTPDLIFFGGFVAEGALLSRARFDPQVGMEDVLFMGADGINTTNYIEDAGDASEGDYSSAARPGETSPGYAEFVARYTEASGEAPTAPFHAHAYDAYMVIANAIETVAKTDADGNLLIGRKALSDAIRATTDYPGLTGNITCDEFGDCGTGEVTVYVVQDGQWVAVTE